MTYLAIWLAFTLGLVIGTWMSWGRYLHREKPTVQWVVTPEVVHNLSSAVVMQWLDQNGLCWMPKGKEITWPGEVKK